MDVHALKLWLSQPLTTLVASIVEDIRLHVENLRSSGVDFYGYALLPGDRGDISHLVAATNKITDIKVPADDSEYRFYRYNVDEWQHYHHGEFSKANLLIGELNEQFRSRYTRVNDDITFDDVENAFYDAFLDAFVAGLDTAKKMGVFQDDETFLAVWISDSYETIMVESVKRLNSEAVAKVFVAEFG